MSVIGGYYFETNYPGDNFLELDKDMADEAIDITNELELIAYIDGMPRTTRG